MPVAKWYFQPSAMCLELSANEKSQLELAIVPTGIEKRVNGVEGGIAKRQNVGRQSKIESRRMPTREKELELVARNG